jgi:hypothetical protein
MVEQLLCKHKTLILNYQYCQGEKKKKKRKKEKNKSEGKKAVLYLLVYFLKSAPYGSDI